MAGILAPRTGIEPMPLAVEAQNLNHWTTREFPLPSVFGLQTSCYHWLQESPLQTLHHLLGRLTQTETTLIRHLGGKKVQKKTQHPTYQK